jgi:methionyl-tRNA formyltransferase
LAADLSFVDSPEASRSSRATTQSWTLSTVTDRGFPAPHQERQDPLRIVFAGTPTAAVPSLAALLESAHEIAAVITRPAARRGRGRSINASPIADLASAAGIELLTPDTPKDKQFQDRLAELDPDAAVVVAYGALLPPPVLAIPRHGWINLHFSLLPAWRGASPVQAAVRAGDEITGASTFRLEAGMDTGPVFGTVTEPVRPSDTAGDLLDRLAVSGAQLLLATLDGLQAGTVQARPQPSDGVSYAGKVTTADARVDWSAPAIAIDRLIRSVTPDPGAWTDSPWGRLVLGPVEIVAGGAERDGRAPEAASPAEGELVTTKREVLVGTGTAPVRLGVVTPPGRRSMPAADWARGIRPAPGTVLA